MNLPACAHALIAILVFAALPACKAKPDHDRAGKAGEAASDRTLAGSLGKQIVVDPARTAVPVRSNGAMTGAASTPGDPCAVRYGARWAARLLPEIPIYPGAKIGEAAGSDAPGCRRRIVSFASAAPAATIVAYYAARARAAGYSAEHLVENDSHVLGGTRGDAAYYITITPARGGGSAVDLIATPGG